MFGLTAMVMVVAGLLQCLPLLFPGAATGDSILSDAANYLLINGVSEVVTLLANAVLSGMLTYAVAQGAIGKRATIGTSWNAIARRIPPLIGQVFLVGLMLLGAIVIPLLPLVIALVAQRSNTGVGAAVIFGLAGLLAALATIFWLMTRTLFAPAALVLEGQGVIDSIKRSWQLTRGRFWRTLGIYLLVSLLAGMIAGFVAVPISTVVLFASGVSLTGAAVATVLSTILAGVLTTPFVAAAMSLLYLDARIRSEGLDLALLRAATE
jgi:hypothetical protein